MSSDFERELAEDWEEFASQLDTELVDEIAEIQIGVSDGMEFGED